MKKKKGKITDRETANRAKVYVYGIKAHNRMEEVMKSNVSIAESMRTISPEPEKDTKRYTLTYGCLVTVTVIILYLYMIWSYFST